MRGRVIPTGRLGLDCGHKGAMDRTVELPLWYHGYKKDLALWPALNTQGTERLTSITVWFCPMPKMQHS
jgi:hypothetical protein